MNILCRIPNAIYMESGGKQKMIDGEVLRKRQACRASPRRTSSRSTRSHKLPWLLFFHEQIQKDKYLKDRP
jgi:hypothetical protein